MSEATTLVEVTAPRPLLVQQARTESALHASKHDLETVEKQFKAVAEAAGLRNKSLNTRRAALSGKIEELTKEQTKIQGKLMALEKARIKAAEVHRGVTLRIGKNRQVVSELMNDVCLAYE
jgi:peptidoglycan hydrolase CwlO-like protein